MSTARSAQLVTAVALALPLCALAQTSWTAGGCPIYYHVGAQVYADTADDALLLLGVTETQYWNGLPGHVVARLRGGIWDTLGLFSHETRAAIRWGDSLIIAGLFTTINGEPIHDIACWNGTAWSSFGYLPENSAILRFRVLNGELYAVGGFGYFDGHWCNGVAKRVGGEWVNVGELEFEGGGLVNDIALYQGQLVICGGITAPDHVGRDIMVFDGTSWSRLMETAVVGAFCSARSLLEYHGDLIITGPIDVNAGNVGHNIMRWDGSEWHAMGDGLTVAPGDFTYFAGGYDLAVKNDLLYVSGGFYYAGGVPASGIATWDGESWCGLGGNLELSVRSMAWYHDTLYVAPAHFAEGISVNCLAKYIGTYPDTCSQNSTALSEGLADPGPLHAFLGAYDELNVSGINTPCVYEICSVDGRAIQNGFIAQPSGLPVRITLPQMSSGLYVFQCPLGAVIFVRP